MKKSIFLTVVGLILGIIFARSLASSMWSAGYYRIDPSLYVVIPVWCIGIANSFSHYTRKIGQLLNPALKLSMISWLSTKSGFLGLFVLLFYLTYILILGWIYGWYLLVRDIISLFRK